ncbi:jg20414, partial [Pararge aegeria aegeria]
MVYVKGDGTVVENHPLSIFGLFWGIVNFCHLL